MDLHQRRRELVLAGGIGCIDASYLLRSTSPQQVREVAVKGIEDMEGRILGGSSARVFDTVPLGNSFAMRKTAIGHRFHSLGTPGRRLSEV